MMTPEVKAWIGVGANLEDPVSAVSRALEELNSIQQGRLTARSSLYCTAPIGANSEGQPDYINAVAEISTTLTPQALLEALFEIERQFGRTRSYRNAPRTLDLDLLMYGDQIIEGPGLHVPHPRMHERAFVLAPLAEIAPTLRIPGKDFVETLLKDLKDQVISRLSA